VDKKYGAERLAFRFGKDVGVSYSLEISGFVLDSRVIGGDFVDHVDLMSFAAFRVGEEYLEDKAETSFEVGWSLYSSGKVQG
jgi:hypothetical protein